MQMEIPSGQRLMAEQILNMDIALNKLMMVDILLREQLIVMVQALQMFI